MQTFHQDKYQKMSEHRCKEIFDEVRESCSDLLLHDIKSE